MYSNIIGMQQIMITAGFLGLMIVVLIILRKKSTVIRASMKAGKRIAVVEDTAVSPTERLRLITVDSKEFIMVSAKGQPPSLVCLAKTEFPNDQRTALRSDIAIEKHDSKVIVEDRMEEKSVKSSFEKAAAFPAAGQIGAQSTDEQHQAFAEKFKRWRRQNDAR